MPSPKISCALNKWGKVRQRFLFRYRKLKNRVAAQTARDRKKARMTELEESLALLEEQVGMNK